LKYLYIKKQKLNEQLYHLHLICSKNWQESWLYIQTNIDEELQKYTEKYYDSLNKKLDALQNKKQPYNRNAKKKQQETKFYTRVNNLSQLVYTNEEMNILNLGFQYSIEKPVTSDLLNIAIETDNAIKLLDINVQSAYRVLATKKLKYIVNSLHLPTLYIKDNYML
jgi:hypothetical protein